MDLFEFDDYRAYLTARVRSMPSRGKGEFRRWADRLKVHPSLLSQIMKGRRDFTSEQAIQLAELLGLDEREGEYFVTLIERERATNERLRSMLGKRLRRLKGADEVEASSKGSRALTESERAIFYSNWFYSAIRLRSAIEPYPNLDTLSSDLGLPRTLVRQVVDFLVEKGLCVEKGGKIQIGPRRTWIDQSSPLVLRHHQNWRLKSVDRMPRKDPQEFYLTLPMTIARKDVDRLRDLILDFEKKVHQVLDETESEELVCLNVDFFRVRGG